MKFGQRPCTIVQGLLPNFGAYLKIHKKFKFDWNQLKLSTHHKYMYICIIDLSPLLIQSYLCTVHSLLPVDIILIPPYTTCSISMCTDVPLINFMIGLTLERKILFV